MSDHHADGAGVVCFSGVRPSNIREAMKKKIVIIPAAIALVLLMGYSKPSQTRRVIVSTLENWSAGEVRDCVLTSDDPASKLPRLDCDLPASNTRQSGRSVIEVRFTTTAERQLYVEWTCERTNNSVICEN